MHDLIGPRRIDVAAEGRLILVRHGEDRQQALEGLEIPNVHGCGDRLRAITLILLMKFNQTPTRPYPCP